MVTPRHSQIITMACTHGVRISTRLRECPRWLAPSIMFALSCTLHAATLQGGFVWDDRPAVLENHDVWTNSPWRDMWRHDFWGQKMADPESHKSFRPLTTLTYRLNNEVFQRHFTGNARRADDEGQLQPSDAMGFHLVNVLVHALTCALSLRLFRGIFRGEELPTLMASMLFTVHPVHVEAVAPLVGRADVLCGFLAVAALCLTVEGVNTTGNRNRRKVERSTCITAFDRVDGGERQHGSATNEAIKTEQQREGHEVKISTPVAANKHNTHSSAVLVMVKGTEKYQKRMREKCTGSVANSSGITGEQVDEERGLSGIAVGPSAFSFVISLLLATAATLCKEVGVTVFFIIAGAEIVRFFQVERRGGMFSAEAAATGMSVAGVRVALREYKQRFGIAPPLRMLAACSSALLLVALHLVLHDGQAVREWGVLENDISVLPSLKHRVLSYAHTHAFYAFKLFWPDRLCYDWGFRCIPHVTSLKAPQNLGAIASYTAIALGTLRAVFRADTALMWGLALAVVTFLPASNILFPIGAVVAERLLYLPSLGACVLAGCLVRARTSPERKTRLRTPGNANGQTNLHKEKDVEIQGTVALEDAQSRSFSVNEAYFVGDVLRASAVEETQPQNVQNSEAGAMETAAALDEPDRGEPTPTFAPSRGANVDDIHERKPQGEERFKNASGGRSGDEDYSSEDPRKDSGSFSRSGETEAISFTSGTPPPPPRPDSFALTTSPAVQTDNVTRTKKAPATTLPASSSTVEEKWNTSRVQTLAGVSASCVQAVERHRGMQEKDRKYRFTIVMTLALVWSVYFGRGTVQRCGEWRSERRLFKSALEVCPDGIKTLNNLGAGMLNAEDAPQAAKLLRRAVQLHPDFASALFNLGVALTLTGEHDHEGAIDGLEKSLSLEGNNHKALVYLGQEYLALAQKNPLNASKALPTEVIPAREHAEAIPAHPTSLLSPEELFEKAEFYTNQALVLGSMLPLSRLLKGDILIIRREFKHAADFYRSGIDLSIALNTANNGQRHTESLNLPAVYNKLGLALRDVVELDPVFAKEAFLEGLLRAPENLALLVNGGVAHQAAGDFSGASNLYRRALDLYPGSPELLSNLGWLQEAMGDGSRESLEGAAALYAQALEGLSGVVGYSSARGQVEINLENVRTRLKRLDT